MRVESGEGNRNHLLQALAWIGDAVVVDRFAHWRREPTSWGQSLFVTPQDYSREADWELTADGQRRNLYFAQCVELVPGHSMRPASFLAIQDRKDACPWCHTRLIDLFTIDGTAFQLASGPVRVGAIQVATCEICTAFGTVFGHLDNEAAGNGHTKILARNICRTTPLPGAGCLRTRSLRASPVCHSLQRTSFCPLLSPNWVDIPHGFKMPSIRVVQNAGRP